MLNLPKSTEVSLPLYKKDILANFEGAQKQKEIFNSDIATLRIVNELSARSLPVEPSKTINGIFILEVVPKYQEIHQETIEMIFRLIPQHIVIALHYDDSIRLATYHSKTFMTEWMQIGYTLNIEGLSIDEIWKHIVESIGNFHVTQGRTLEDQIENDSEIQAILLKIEKLETKKRNTKTPRMKYELHQQIQSLTSQLETLKRN